MEVLTFYTHTNDRQRVIQQLNLHHGSALMQRIDDNRLIKPARHQFPLLADPPQDTMSSSRALESVAANRGVEGVDGRAGGEAEAEEGGQAGEPGHRGLPGG